MFTRKVHLFAPFSFYRNESSIPSSSPHGNHLHRTSHCNINFSVNNTACHHRGGDADKTNYYYFFCDPLLKLSRSDYTHNTFSSFCSSLTSLSPSHLPPYCHNVSKIRKAVHSFTTTSSHPATALTTPRRAFCYHPTFISHHRPSSSQSNMSAEDIQREAKLMPVLAELGFTLPTIEHEPKTTVEEANKELSRFGTPCTGTKNMFLKSKKGELVLVTALHDTPTDIKRIQKEAGTKDLRFAPEDVLAENLGVYQGAVTPFALVNNVDKKNVIVLLDSNLKTTPHPFVLHPCRNDKSSLVTFPQLEAFLNHLGYAFKLVDFGSAPAEAAPAKKEKAPAAKKEKAPVEKKNEDVKGETKLGIQNTIESNFSSWYTEVITKAEMIEYYDVSGCYIIRPWGHYVWKCIQRFFGDRIERMGVEDCYFPLFVAKSCLEREKDHVEGFAPEVAWVTKAGEADLEQPVAIRPTSETVMYPYYGKWIRSHRDLPLRLNQWNNVIRWEFSHPTPFIRTREFLWQEGHCVWPTEKQCTEEVLEILDGYAAVYEELLAVPVVKGRKTEKEKFAGAYFTTTVETYIGSVGRGCQGGTSHNLGQNFAKMFDISYQDPENNDKTIIPWQNSWGLSTRTIGVMVMVHGDNKGLVMPPRVAQVQVVIIPVGITKSTSDQERDQLLEEARRLEKELNNGGVRSRADLRDNYSPGWRFNHWEVKGVPLRIELGPKELQEKQLALAVRYNGEKRTVAWDGNLVKNVLSLLDEIHHGMFNKAAEIRKSRTVRVTDWKDFVPSLNNKCVLLSPWCGEMSCEDNIKTFSAEESKAAQSEEVREDARAPSMGAKSLCIPFEQPEPAEGHKCVCKDCNKPAKQWVLWGRSY